MRLVTVYSSGDIIGSFLNTESVKQCAGEEIVAASVGEKNSFYMVSLCSFVFLI